LAEKLLYDSCKVLNKPAADVDLSSDDYIRPTRYGQHFLWTV